MADFKRIRADRNILLAKILYDLFKKNADAKFSLLRTTDGSFPRP